MRDVVCALLRSAEYFAQVDALLMLGYITARLRYLASVSPGLTRSTVPPIIFLALDKLEPPRVLSCELLCVAAYRLQSTRLEFSNEVYGGRKLVP